MRGLGGHGRAQHQGERGRYCGDPRNCGTIGEPTVIRNFALGAAASIAVAVLWFWIDSAGPGAQSQEVRI
jgi:hypothetical protein